MECLYMMWEVTVLTYIQRLGSLSLDTHMPLLGMNPAIAFSLVPSLLCLYLNFTIIATHIENNKVSV